MYYIILLMDSKVSEIDYQKDEKISFASEDVRKAASQRLDRDKTCPFLLRLFFKEGRSHRSEEFEGANLPSEELNIYTWMDANLREISEYVQKEIESCRKRDTQL
jgi:histone deacetylase complex subunit SAP18